MTDSSSKSRGKGEEAVDGCHGIGRGERGADSCHCIERGDPAYINIHSEIMQKDLPSSHSDRAALFLDFFNGLPVQF